jgi:hypothetical protein
LRKLIRAVVTTAATTLALLSPVAVTPALAAGSYHGCPYGAACVYPGNSYNNDRPALVFESYGPHNLSNQFGEKLAVNNQYGGATAWFCSGYDGKGSPVLPWLSGTVEDGSMTSEISGINFTPINSVVLGRAGERAHCG